MHSSSGGMAIALVESLNTVVRESTPVASESTEQLTCLLSPAGVILGARCAQRLRGDGRGGVTRASRERERPAALAVTGARTTDG